MVVVRVQHLGQLFRVDALLLGAQEIAIVEFGQVERMSVFGLPQTQWLGDVVAIAKHRQVPGFAGNDERRLPFAVFADFPADADLDIQRLVMAEPRVAVTPPVVRGFHLLAIVKGLAEQTILIVEAVTGRRLPHRRHGVEEAGCQTSQAAVTQRRVCLFFQQIGEVDVVAFQRVADALVPAQVEQVVAGQATNQKLHRDVVNVTLSLRRFRYRLRRQKFRQRSADRAPPLTLCHLGSGL